MNKFSYTDHGFTFIRIPKNKAERAYKVGLTVVLCPCNVKPGTPWHSEIPVNHESNVAFDDLISLFEGSNCNSISGRYTAFYIPVRTVDRFTGQPSHSFDAVTEYDYDYLGK